MKKRSIFLISSLAFGFSFLYVPILVMIAFSFNEANLSTTWTGLSLKWYQKLFENEQALKALMLSLRIALISATFATILGTLAGLALARFGHFKSRLFLAGMVSAPLVMPEVITGLAMLLFFISIGGLIGWPSGRGVTTITIAHITFSMAYVAVVVQSRLSSLDQSLEEAAMDLGGRPIRIFFDITLPLTAPAMMAGWLLAFTLSLDDLVISRFVSGPGANTLPMYIFSKVKLGISPDINALATLMIGTVACTIGLAGYLSMRHRASRGSGDG